MICWFSFELLLLSIDRVKGIKHSSGKTYIGTKSVCFFFQRGDYEFSNHFGSQVKTERQIKKSNSP